MATVNVFAAIAAVVADPPHDEHIDASIATHHARTPRCEVKTAPVAPQGNCSLGRRYTSQFGEDRALEAKYFPCDGPPGFFIEIGGFTGVRYSNSLHFEDLGWRGVMIEGFPPNFEQMVKSRPKAASVGRAICQNFSTVEFMGNAEVGGRATATAGVVEAMKPTFFELWYPKKKTASRKVYEVQCGPIGPYLHVLGIPWVDYFSLDVEGSEENVLKSMIWDIPIHVMMVEMDEHDEEANNRIRAIMTGVGFTEDTEIDVKLSGIFVNQSFVRPNAINVEDVGHCMNARSRDLQELCLHSCDPKAQEAFKEEQAKKKKGRKM